MKALFIAVGDCILHCKETDADGNIVEESSAQFIYTPDGGSVAIGRLNIENDGMEPDGPAEIFADWDAAGYLAKVLEILQPTRSINFPDVKAILEAAVEDGNFDYLCEYCTLFPCGNCIIEDWKNKILN